MTLRVEMMWCNECQKNTGHIQQRMNHVLHLLGTIVTGGLWIIGWIASAVAWRRRPWLCMGCGYRYTTPSMRSMRDAI